jgi:hypothetical protein
MTREIDPDTPGCTGGLPLGERTDHNSRPSDDLLEGTQVWIWLNGANPPRWEIRGTGLVTHWNDIPEQRRRHLKEVDEWIAARERIEYYGD